MIVCARLVLVKDQSPAQPAKRCHRAAEIARLSPGAEKLSKPRAGLLVVRTREAAASKRATISKDLYTPKFGRAVQQVFSYVGDIESLVKPASSSICTTPLVASL